MKRAILFSLLTFLSSCNPTQQSPQESKSGGINNSPLPSNDKTNEVLEMSPVQVGIKNYNQYNMTLQKLTGINRSTKSKIFNDLVGSLPSDNDINGLTSFNLVAMTRLADAYCTDYVNSKMPSQLFGPNQDEDIIDYLMDAFLDAPPGDDPTYYSSLRAELNNIFDNNDGSGNKLFPNPSSEPVRASKDYSTVACIAILSSPYITLLE